MRNTSSFAVMALVLANISPAHAAAAQVQAIPPKHVTPSFNCAKALPRSIDKMICNDRELSILDRTMGLDYERAKLQTPPVEAAGLLSEQREFIANRNLCMKRRADRQACIAFAYESRIERLGEWIDRSAWRGE